MVTGMLAGMEAWLDVDALPQRIQADGASRLECAPG
jgi:hypothetical protein